MTKLEKGNVVEVLYKHGRRWVVLIESFKLDHNGVWSFQGSYYDPTSSYSRIETGGGFTMSEMISLTFHDPKDTMFSKPMIYVGSDVVEFKKDGVQVGCTFVPTATVDQIYKHLHK